MIHDMIAFLPPLLNFLIVTDAVAVCLDHSWYITSIL